MVSSLPAFEVESPESDDGDNDGKRELATIKLSGFVAFT
jgi:hypothetical protein